MNDAFVTTAIKKDRYLKATRLVDQFESEIIRELKNTCKRIIEDNDKLFPDDPSLSTKKFDNSSSLRTLRVKLPLNRVVSHEEDSDTVTFYMAIEWTEPEDRGEDSPTDSALCVAHYKLLPTPREDFESVKAQTNEAGDWNIRFGDDIHDSDRGVCYIPITDATEMDDALSELRKHVSTYGHEYGVPM
ncbi:hypothetical protein [Halapricum desulfuricans]|uniref:hypothetical protein n=1 Tax=Halapricum desulfuricans TaxID=2841257 RepID=UPI001E3F4645|nr:hypothetical protein [Halapricum desulfuricans]